MNRRNFIQNTGLITTGITLGGLSSLSFKSDARTKITILHTNDTHSHIDPFDANHPKYANQGGIAKRSTLINSIRKENPHTLLLDAGDIFQGTPYFNFYGGELEFKLMSMLKYDCATLGNHDFDNGVDGFYKQLPHAKFDFVSSNYDFKNTILDSLVKPYKTFVKNGIKIGVFGLGVQLEGLVLKQLYKETTYLDPIEISEQITQTLKNEEQCDLIICLSHLGYEYKGDASKISDLKLAAATKNIDLIVGGHTHTFLDKPTSVTNKDGKQVLVNQVGKYGINLGRVDFYFDSVKNIETDGKSIKV